MKKENIQIFSSGKFTFKGFIKTCKELDLNTFPISKEDILKEKEVKKWT